MAIRNVDTDLWNDAKISETFTSDDLLFWLFLLTTRYSNFAGCFQITPRQIQIDLKFGSVEKVEKLIARFENEHKLIAYDYETHEVLIFNWLRYNVNKSSNHKIAVENHAEKIKNQDFKSYIYDLLEKGLDRGYIGAYKPLKTNTKTITNTNSKTNSKLKDKELSKEKKTYGVMNNVKLTDDEYAKLNELFPTHWAEYIDKLSLYISSKGDKYKSHYATVRAWLLRDNIATNDKSEDDLLDEDLAKVLYRGGQ